MFRDRTFQICLGLALILASPTFLPFSSRAAGQDNTKSGMKEMTKVVAHIPLPGSAVRQLLDAPVAVVHFGIGRKFGSPAPVRTQLSLLTILCGGSRGSYFLVSTSQACFDGL